MKKVVAVSKPDNSKKIAGAKTVSPTKRKKTVISSNNSLIPKGKGDNSKKIAGAKKVSPTKRGKVGGAISKRPKGKR